MPSTCIHCGGALQGMSPDCPRCGYSDVPPAPPAGLLGSALAALLGMAILMLAVQGLSRTEFWSAVPVVLKRALDR